MNESFFSYGLHKILSVCFICIDLYFFKPNLEIIKPIFLMKLFYISLMTSVQEDSMLFFWFSFVNLYRVTGAGYQTNVA